MQPAVTRHTHLSLAGTAIVDPFFLATYYQDLRDKHDTKSIIHMIPVIKSMLLIQGSIS